MLRCLLHRAAGTRRSPPCLSEAAGATAAEATRCLSGTRARASTFPSSATSTSPPSLGDTDLSSPDGDAPGQVRIDAYDATSFELSIAGKVPGSTRRRKVRGPLVLSAPGGFVATWRVASASASASASPPPPSSSASLASIAALVSPRPDIVIVGTGRAASAGSGSGGASFSSSAPTAARGAGEAAAAAASGAREISEAAGGAAVEFYPTARAAALYNVLSQEGRSVLAAMLPAGEDGSSFFSK